MALTSFSNFETLENLNILNFPLDPFAHDSENPFLFLENQTHFFPYNDPLISLSPEATAYPQNFISDYDFYPYPKRQKSHETHVVSDFNPTGFDGFGSYYSCIPLPDISWNGRRENEKKSTEKTVSGQSIAARERRRKITEKTQELGRLVPGGTKLNTADMLQAAFKYVNFLQAQVGILQFIRSFQEGEEEATKISEEMQILQSPLLQEKLYSNDKCLVPADSIQALIKRSDSQLNPSISDHLNRLLQSDQQP